MTSDFPYYLALFGLTFFLTVICCCVKLIDIIDRPARNTGNTMPSWDYANYLQNSPVAILSNPHPDQFLRYSMLGENQGLSGEEYLTATTCQPGLYRSTSRSIIRAAAAAAAAATAPTATSSIASGGSNNESSSSIGENQPGVPMPPPAPPAPTPVIPSNPVLYSIHVPEERTRCVRHGAGVGGELPPKYEEVCFDV